MAAATSSEKAAFETVPIAPSISSAWTMVLTTITSASAVWPIRQAAGDRRSRRRTAASRAVAKTAHMATTPKGEKDVGDWKSRASITSGALVIHSPATWATTSATRTTPSHR